MTSLVHLVTHWGGPDPQVGYLWCISGTDILILLYPGLYSSWLILLVFLFGSVGLLVTQSHHALIKPKYKYISSVTDILHLKRVRGIGHCRLPTASPPLARSFSSLYSGVTVTCSHQFKHKLTLSSTQIILME